MDSFIYINRSLRLDKIKAVGFDMDATLAIYKSPISEELAFNLSLNRLVQIGYPRDILHIHYRDDFVTRNAWFDKKLGNLLKTDEHCNILTAFHGFTKLEKKEIRDHYRNKHVTLEESRIFVLNTVFNVPEALLLASLVDYFEHNRHYQKLPNGTGYTKYDTEQVILYSSIFEDCRGTIDYIHVHGNYKKTVLDNITEYIATDDRALRTMSMLAGGGRKLFLLTNSPWEYTDKILSYVMGSNWRDLFDVVIVDGSKPKWFLQDVPFKEVDLQTGSEMVGVHAGPLKRGHVYSKGCAADFIARMNLTGKDILYVGDHIFGDVLRSKKTGGWRTLLIVPELDRELKIWTSQCDKFKHLIKLNGSLSHSESANGSVKKDTLKEIAKITDEMEAEYGAMGSMLRCGWRQTHFASQLKKYADIYTCNVYALAEYSPSFYFNSPIVLLPHEEKFMKALSFGENNEEEENKEQVQEEQAEEKDKEENAVKTE